MARLLKWVFGIVLLLVVLVVAAAIILPMVIDPNDYKDEIVAAVKDETGRDLRIDKPIELSVFPWLGMGTGGVSLSNAEGFADQPFAQVGELQLRVKLMPLLSKQVEVDTLVLSGLRLNLEKDKSGRTNWDDLAKPKQDQQAEPQETSDGAADFVLKVQGVRIEDALISWMDRQTGESYTLQDMKLVSDSLEPGQPAALEMALTLLSEAPKRRLDLQVDTRLTTDAGFQVFDVAGLRLSLAAQGEGLPQDGVTIELSGDVKADLEQGTVSVPGIEVSGPEVALNAELSVSGLNEQPKVDGRVQLDKTDIKRLADLFGVKIDTADPAALTRFSADLRLSQDGKALRIDPLKATLDDSQLDGHVHLLDPQGPVVRVALNLDQINLDRYMPPKQEQPEQPAAESEQAAGEDPFAALRTLDLEAKATVGKLVVSNLKMSQITLTAVSKDGVLTLDPMGAQLYEGSFTGKAKLDVRKDTPRFHAVKDLIGIQIGSLLKDLAGEDRLLGKGELHIDMGAQGMTDVEIKRTLNGTASFRFDDGAYRGVNIAKLLRTAGSALGLSEPPPKDASDQTDFSEMSASVKVTNGRVRNDDLKAQSPLLRIEGKGDVDLNGESVDYVLTTELVSSLEGQGGKSRDQLSGVPIPVKISGPFTKLKYEPQLEGLLEGKAKQRIEEEKAKLKEKAGKELEKVIPGGLKGLFGN